MSRRLTWNTLLALTMSAGVAVASGLTGKVQVLNSDLYISFTCETMNESSIEPKLQQTLETGGFRTANIAAERLTAGWPVFNLYIVGVNEDGEFIQFASSALSGSPASFSIALVTPPPTERDHAVEGSLEKLVSDELDCTVRDISRGVNDEHARSLYEEELQRIITLIEEADSLRDRRR